MKVGKSVVDLIETKITPNEVVLLIFRTQDGEVVELRLPKVTQEEAKELGLVMTLDEIRKLIEAATPGPWTLEYRGSAPDCQPAHVSMRGEGGRHEIVVDHRRDFSDPAPDAHFIAAARTLLPALLEVAEKAEALFEDEGMRSVSGGGLAEALAALEAIKLS